MHRVGLNSAVQCAGCEPAGETDGAVTHGGARFAVNDGAVDHGHGCESGCGVACELVGRSGSGVAVERTVAGRLALCLERRLQRLRALGATG